MSECSDVQRPQTVVFVSQAFNRKTPTNCPWPTDAPVIQKTSSVADNKAAASPAPLCSGAILAKCWHKIKYQAPELEMALQPEDNPRHSMLRSTVPFDLPCRLQRCLRTGFCACTALRQNQESNTNVTRNTGCCYHVSRCYAQGRGRVYNSSGY